MGKRTLFCSGITQARTKCQVPLFCLKTYIFLVRNILLDIFVIGTAIKLF